MVVVATATVLNIFGAVYQIREEPTVCERIVATTAVLLDRRQYDPNGRRRLPRLRRLLRPHGVRSMM